MYTPESWRWTFLISSPPSPSSSHLPGGRSSVCLTHCRVTRSLAATSQHSDNVNGRNWADSLHMFVFAAQFDCWLFLGCARRETVLQRNWMVWPAMTGLGGERMESWRGPDTPDSLQSSPYLSLQASARYYYKKNPRKELCRSLPAVGGGGQSSSSVPSLQWGSPSQRACRGTQSPVSHRQLPRAHWTAAPATESQETVSQSICLSPDLGMSP